MEVAKSGYVTIINASLMETDLEYNRRSPSRMVLINQLIRIWVQNDRLQCGYLSDYSHDF